MVLYLLNALVTPFKGTSATFNIQWVTISTAQMVFKWSLPHVQSALGHEAAVQAFKLILGDHPSISLNRTQVFLEKGDEALALVLKSRIPEGTILSLEQMLKIGFDIYHIRRTE